jgi:plastocyanin domain-containing protein
MHPSQWLVLILGISGIALVNWYFFLGKRPLVQAQSSATGAQEITIQVLGGYSPNLVRVRRGQPVRLTFDRQEKSGCSEEVVLGSFGIRRFLPPFKKTVVEFTPEKSGSYEFTCGMGMLRGQIVVE